MRHQLAVVTFIIGLVGASSAQAPALAGNWVGSIDTTRGMMEIGLEIAVANGKTTGRVITMHGDWPVTGAAVKDGVWTVSFEGTDNRGQLIGRVTDQRFTGEWKSEMADGTFELTRSRKR